MLAKILFLIVVFILFTVLFKFAAGTLSLRKINMVGFAYYNILIFSFIGAAIVFLGFRNHYLIAKINSVEVVDKTIYILAYTLVMLPLSILLFNTIFLGRNVKHKYENYLTAEVVTNDISEKNIIVFLWLMLFVGLLSTMYVFVSIGGIPIINVLLSGADPNILRAKASGGFTGNAIIKNIVMLILTPLVSYVAYIYFRTTKIYKKEWAILFICSFALSIVIKTYDLEKAPVIYYMFYYYVIEVILGNKKLFNYLITFGVFGVLAIVFQYYVLSGYSGSIFTISSGPGGRILMTQIATLFLHVQTFPLYEPYLKGASFPTIIANILGSPSSWVRSGRVVMERYNPGAVAEGIAGSMNALFVGEAYANWGLFGVIIAPILVALTFSIGFSWTLKHDKTPLSIAFYIFLFSTLTGGLQGGFIDYIYNVGLLVVIIVLWTLMTMARNSHFRVKVKY